MNARIIDTGRPVEMQPLSCTRDIGQMRIANRPLVDLQKDALSVAGFEIDDFSDGKLGLYLSGSAWLSEMTLEKLRLAEKPAVVKNAAGDVLAWVSNDGKAQEDAEEISADAGDMYLKYPWDLLKLNERMLADMDGEPIDIPGVLVEGYLSVGEGTRILPGVVIQGNVVIGNDCNIGPNCYIRGYTAIGNSCHVGNAVEVKNSILYDHVSVGHLSYCGDTIVGEKTNFGAGTITSNFRHDGKNHRSMVCGELLDTGRRKFGSIMGDGVHTGIHTSIYPGRKIWAGCSTLPGAIVKYDITE